MVFETESLYFVWMAVMYIKVWSFSDFKPFLSKLINNSTPGLLGLELNNYIKHVMNTDGIELDTFMQGI